MRGECCVFWRVFLSQFWRGRKFTISIYACAPAHTTHSVSREAARNKNKSLGKENMHTFLCSRSRSLASGQSCSLKSSLKNLFGVCIFRSVQANGAGHPGDFRAVGPGVGRPHPVHLRGSGHSAPRDQGRLRAQLQGVLHQPAPQPGTNEPSE